MADYHEGRNVLYVPYVRTYNTYIYNGSREMYAGIYARVYTHLHFAAPPTYVNAYVRAFLHISLSLSSSSLVAFHGTHGRGDGRGIHHLAPHGRYTSNTLRVSQLTPSQTFHFVVQRARHGAHDGSHKWKPSPAGPMLQFVSCFHGGTSAGRERGTTLLTARGERIHGPSRIRKIALIFARDPPGVAIGLGDLRSGVHR